MVFKMGQVIKVKFNTSDFDRNNKYEMKLIRIRDQIENYLMNASIIEDDELAIALAAGRYGTMKLAKLTGEVETKKFINDCIITTLHSQNKNL